jgi:glycosyltransferase involved in cell wall biosynthesis
MSKLKVLCILPLPPPIHGSTVMANIINKSLIINETFVCDYININVSTDIYDIGKFSFRKIRTIFLSYVLTITKLIKNKYDVCYIANSPTGPAFVKDSIYIIVCKLFCKNIILHQHGKGFSKYREKSIYNYLYRICFKDVKVILLSWRLYNDISYFVKKDQIYICPNGIPEIYNYQPNYDKENKVLRLLFLSNLIISKGVYELLNACKILKDKGYIFECLFIGGHTKELSLKIFHEEIQKRDLNDFVKYLGTALFEKKSQFYEMCDIFVFPTFHESFGLVLLEAMQHGLPIVTTYEGGIPDIVKDNINGFLCYPQDNIGLAEKIEILLNDKHLRIKFGENGFKIFKSKFKKDTFEKKIIEIFYSVISNKSL